MTRLLSHHIAHEGASVVTGITPKVGLRLQTFD
jgi:hypothetical protein